MEKLWYQKPADEWEEALPLGNGRLGAMVFGQIQKEQIQVNEESIWYGKRRERINPDAKENLPKIREYIRNGQIQKAQKPYESCNDWMPIWRTNVSDAW